MFVDEKGAFISPDLMIACWGTIFWKRRAKKASCFRISEVQKQFLSTSLPWGLKWPPGRSAEPLPPRLRELNGVYGGELAGHYYFRDFFYSDSGIMAALIILGIISKMKSRGLSLSQLISRIERYKNSGEINFKVEEKQRAMDIVKDWFISQEQPTASYDFDGYRVEFKSWWFNIRPSNTEPYLRFIAEAETEEVLQSRVSKVKELISEL